jgi:2-keto-3-deoxy-L-rhamnonate aldolase RhmA
LIVGGLAAHPEGAQALAARGFRFVTLSSDAQLLAQQTRNYVQSFRQAKEG